MVLRDERWDWRSGGRVARWYLNVEGDEGAGLRVGNDDEVGELKSMVVGVVLRG